MVNVKVNTNSSRKSIIANVDTTIYDFCGENGISIGNAVIHLDGSVVMSDEMDMTFEELGVEDESEVTLSLIVKADSAGL